MNEKTVISDELLGYIGRMNRLKRRVMELDEVIIAKMEEELQVDEPLYRESTFEPYKFDKDDDMVFNWGFQEGNWITDTPNVRIFEDGRAEVFGSVEEDTDE